MNSEFSLLPLDFHHSICLSSFFSKTDDIVLEEMENIIRIYDKKYFMLHMFKENQLKEFKNYFISKNCCNLFWKVKLDSCMNFQIPFHIIDDYSIGNYVVVEPCLNYLNLYPNISSYESSIGKNKVLKREIF